MISCGRAKTIPIRQRILRKYSKLKKKKHYCVRRGKALEFLRVSLRDTVPIMHMHERLLVISCGRAKTIPIRQRILRKYSEVKKKKTFLSLKRLVTILSLARPPGDLESLFDSPYCFFEGKLFSEVDLWHLTYPPL